ncbi:TetR/AcrR family transcriptional regulator [Fervidobacterium nodosum]|uniref:Transcriptional regulator, TetR family n=1 Tax=Fervidobacterium nodosum (strain ATCC 35602 / DSM 5306 / Rt17-B1) TaxID=381764 RepID=A7HJH5_FERNB|nr:TetR/AcrR family transcriptional regulator [Fervidobacterium nodosum]ABS60058.1 transcriptional regulator, TetR family [Fervidobacterium nodosum Rt17-B1]
MKEVKNETKKDLILKIALEEFANYGFVAASTNRIAKKAGISKGLIFKYFKSKEKLYFSVFEQLISELYSVVLPKIEVCNDFFDSLIEVTKSKIEYFIVHPLEFKFLEILRNDLENVNSKVFTTEMKKKLIELMMNEEKKSYNTLWEKFSNIKLKDGIDRNFAFEFTFTVLKSYGNLLLNKYSLQKNMEDGMNKILDELKKVIEFIKYGIL